MGLPVFRVKKKTFMEQPKGFINITENFLWRLRKTIYGLHQAGRNWSNEFNQRLRKIGFRKFDKANCIYLWETSGILLVYVDDLLLLAENEKVLKEIKGKLFEILDLKDLGCISPIPRSSIRGNVLRHIDAPDSIC